MRHKPLSALPILFAVPLVMRAVNVPTLREASAYLLGVALCLYAAKLMGAR